MISKKELQKYAHLLMFDMSDAEYQTLAHEFDFFIAQMKKIEDIEKINEVEPMVFPFSNSQVTWREDQVKDYLTVDEVLANASHQLNNQVKVPKVVE